MNYINDVILFQGGGLNWDDPIEFMPKGDGRERRNVVIEEKNGRAIFTNIKGNRQRNLLTLPSGTNTVIGACEDKENNACVYFVHNSGGNHCIIRYVAGAAETAYPLLYSQSVLNFSLSKRIHNPFVIGELLYWTDGNNPPRKINMTKAD